MGTSRNDRSPSTPPWRMANAVLGAPDIPVDRQSLEIWQAVAADRGSKLVRDFSNPSLAAACRLVSKNLSVEEALSRFNRLTQYESDAGLAIDMGRRALTRCIAQRGDANRFVGELFAEAISYYASRDLPSFVAGPGRVANSSEVIRLKDHLRETTREQIKNVGNPKFGPKGWHEYIAKALAALRAGGRPK